MSDIISINKTIDDLGSLMSKLERYGLPLFLHNHHWEFELVDGRPISLHSRRASKTSIPDRYILELLTSAE